LKVITSLKNSRTDDEIGSPAIKGNDNVTSPEIQSSDGQSVFTKYATSSPELAWWTGVVVARCLDERS